MTKVIARSIAIHKNHASDAISKNSRIDAGALQARSSSSVFVVKSFERIIISRGGGRGTKKEEIEVDRKRMLICYHLDHRLIYYRAVNQQLDQK